MASLAEIQALVERIHSDLPLLINRSQIAPKQVVIVNGLSDMSERLGLVQAGEFRAGNGKEPGFLFSGVRIGYPAFAYAGDTYNFVGVENDVLQIGISADDGKLYFGAGTGVLNNGGIELQASGLLVNSNGYKFVDADNTDNIMGGVYSIVRHDFNDLFVELRAHPEDTSLSTVTASVDAVGSSAAFARLTSDSGAYGGNASMLILMQTGSERKLYTTDVLDHRFDGGAVFNESMADLDFVVYGTGDGVDNDPAFWVDAGANRASFGSDHFFGIGAGSSVLINERGLDIDLIYDDATDTTLIHGDASTGRVGIGILNPSYKLHVNGDINIESGSRLLLNEVDITEGWVKVTETWTRTGNHTFTISGDLTSRYGPGTKVLYDEGGGNEFGVVGSSSVAAGTTTVNLIPNSDYAMSGNPSSRYISIADKPKGWPQYFNHTFAMSASSGTITSYTQQVGYWYTKGRSLRMVTAHTITNNGTGASAILIGAPIASQNFSNGGGRENGITGTVVQSIASAGSSTIIVWKYDNLYPGGTNYQITNSIEYTF